MEKKSEYSNIPPSIEAKIGRRLHNKKNHPIEIMKRKLFDYFKTLDDYDFSYFDDINGEKRKQYKYTYFCMVY